MARYRTYKNGIYGHRYQGYYIIKGEKNNFTILDKDGNTFRDKLLDFDECEWEIDKATASDEDLLIIMSLYGKEIYQLSSMFVELMQKKGTEGLDPRSETLYKWVGKIRKRKANDREY